MGGSIKNDSYCQKLMSDLLEMAKASMLSDVTIKVGDTLIPCHKAVLSAGSNYFRAMFSSNEVEIKGCDVHAVSMLIGYIYTGQMDVNADTVQSLIQASDLMELTAVRDACLRYALQLIDASNCIGFKRFGQLHSVKECVDKAQQCWRQTPEKVMTSPEFLDLTEEELQDYLSDDQLDVEREDAIFEALVAWTYVNPHMRESTFRNLLPRVRLELCTPDFLCDVVQEEPLMQSHDAKSRVLKAVSYQLKARHGDGAACPQLPPKCHEPGTAASEVFWGKLYEWIPQLAGLRRRSLSAIKQ